MFVQKDVLARALATVKKSVPSKAALPILTSVNLCAEGDVLHVRGTDLETFTTASIRGDNLNEENVCVPFATFNAAIAELEDGDITLEATETSLKVRQGKTKIDFPAFPAMEFPLVPAMDTKDVISLEVGETELAFARVLHAASNDMARPVLTGVYISLVGGVLTTTCADGFRMAVSNIKVESEDEFTSLIPTSAVQVMLAALADDGWVEIYADGERIAFNLPENEGVSTTVYCQKIEGSYVNYKQIIPALTVAPFLVEKEEIVKALKLGKIFARNNANVIRHTVSEDLMEFSSYSMEDGDFSKTISGEYDGEEISFGLNFAYEMDTLSTLSGVVAIECTSPSRPIVMYRDGERNEYLCVLMPMHIRDR